jgi:hypothetical protein
MNYRSFLSVIFLVGIISTLQSKAQVLTQTVRGAVMDKISQVTLPGASVQVLNSNPVLATVTNEDGVFTLKEVPVGLHSIRVNYLGYKELVVPNVRIISGKEVVLSINLEDNFIQGKEVTITGEVEKNRALNEFSTVSTRTFSVEETQKYAAAVNDPARMSMAYAGVIATEDGNNNIAIRGNAPNGLLWKMEGVDIPNPNHFSAPGTSGGGISILSSQLLTNSDFLTGAFAAEYGNALSGVFDMKLRKGNNQKTERTFQAGFLGTDLAIEGPFKLGYNGSYLVNYRYSTLALLEKIGVPIGAGVTSFQDLSYNIFLPTNRLGSFSLFGFIGLSNQDVEAEKDSLDWENNYDRYSTIFKSNTGMAGLSHFIQLDNNTYLKTSLVASGSVKEYSQEKLDNLYNEIAQGTEANEEGRLSLISTLTKKVNASNSIKAGVIANEIFYDLNKSAMDDYSQQIITEIDQNGKTMTLQSFIQWKYRATEKLTFNTGLHALAVAENKTYSIEPRASAQFEISPFQIVTLGYGLHGQTQPIGVYFARQNESDGTYTEPNRNLSFTKAHHIVLGYDRSLNEFMHIKLETYYQHLFNVPVSTDPASTLSLINNEYGYETEPLVNNGTGRNYGLELTLEQFLHNDLYFLLSTSVYDSKYKAPNNNWYNTRFNGNFAVSFTGGKEFRLGEKPNSRILGINLKTIYSGGLRNTPIDYEASVQAGETKYIETRAYELQAKNYFRTDLKFSLKRNRPKSTTTWSLDIQNVTNHKNEYGEYYDPYTGTTKTSYQMPLIPVLSYKIEF